MPLLHSSYPPGRCLDYIEALPDPHERKIALAEYCFFKGCSEEAAGIVAEYQDSRDPALCLSANLIGTFANLTGSHTHLTRFAVGNLKEQVSRCLGENSPQGIRALTWAESGLALSPAVYPIPFIYCHIVAAIALMNLKRTQQAMAHMTEAWALAEPDGLIQPFAEHHGLLHGLVETFFGKRYLELHRRMDRLTYAFSAGWRAIHNVDTQYEAAENLTTLEFTIAMLYSRNWSAAEIGAHLGISERTVYNRIDGIYSKLGISDKKHLNQYMLK